MNLLSDVWRQTLMSVNTTLGEAVLNLDQSGLRIILITDNSGFLLGTITDGDIRRGLLKGLNLASPVTQIINNKPLVVTASLNKDLVMQIMAANKIYQIPIVNEHHHVIGLHLWDQIMVSQPRENVMIIMAGGLGKRLHPYTEQCPKPMLLVAGKPMLEHIVNNAKSEGFTRLIIAINYLGHIIKDYFSDGEKFGVQISYIEEQEPLGTAGALSLLTSLPDAPIVVTNGDVISDIKYGEVLDFHVRNYADATMALRSHELQIPYGVVQTRGIEIVGIDEKPILRNNINAGIYVISPSALNILSASSYCDMPNFIEDLIVNSYRIIAYPVHEPWLDVGRPEDLRIANEALNKNI